MKRGFRVLRYGLELRVSAFVLRASGFKGKLFILGLSLPRSHVHLRTDGVNVGFIHDWIHARLGAVKKSDRECLMCAGEMLVVQMRVNVNLKSKTMEELVANRKQLQACSCFVVSLAGNAVAISLLRA
eukprot:2781308-Rhodomonas_salina.1